jgi:hypothetical protein
MNASDGRMWAAALLLLLPAGLLAQTPAGDQAGGTKAKEAEKAGEPQPQIMINPMMDVSDPLGMARASRVISDQCKGFDGVWADNWGTTIHMLNGLGQYVFQGIKSSIVGKVQGRKLIGMYYQPNYPAPEFQQGKLEFELSTDGKTWKGTSWDKEGKAESGWEADCIGPYAPPTPTPTFPPTPTGASKDNKGTKKSGG